MTLLDNLEANAHVKGLNVEKLVLNHVQVNQSQKGRRRTFRAHGRINRKIIFLFYHIYNKNILISFIFYLFYIIKLIAYLNHPCNVEIWAQEKAEDVKRESNKT